MKNKIFEKFVLVKQHLKGRQNQNRKMSDKPIPKINVVIRKRPLSRKELASNDVDICEVRMKNSVIVRELK